MDLIATLDYFSGSIFVIEEAGVESFHHVLGKENSKDRLQLVSGDWPSPFNTKDEPDFVQVSKPFEAEHKRPGSGVLDIKSVLQVFRQPGSKEEGQVKPKEVKKKFKSEARLKKPAEAVDVSSAAAVSVKKSAECSVTVGKPKKEKRGKRTAEELEVLLAAAAFPKVVPETEFARQICASDSVISSKGSQRKKRKISSEWTGSAKERKITDATLKKDAATLPKKLPEVKEPKISKKADSSPKKPGSHQKVPKLTKESVKHKSKSCPSVRKSLPSSRHSVGIGASARLSDSKIRSKEERKSRKEEKRIRKEKRKKEQEIEDKMVAEKFQAKIPKLRAESKELNQIFEKYKNIYLSKGNKFHNASSSRRRASSSRRRASSSYHRSRRPSPRRITSARTTSLGERKNVRQSHVHVSEPTRSCLPVGVPFPLNILRRPLTTFRVKPFFRIHEASSVGEHGRLFDLLRNLTAKVTKAARQNGLQTCTLDVNVKARFKNRVPFALYDAPRAKIPNRDLRERGSGRRKLDERYRKSAGRYDYELNGLQIDPEGDVACSMKNILSLYLAIPESPFGDTDNRKSDLMRSRVTPARRMNVPKPFVRYLSKILPLRGTSNRLDLLFHGRFLLHSKVGARYSNPHSRVPVPSVSYDKWLPNSVAVPSGTYTGAIFQPPLPPGPPPPIPAPPQPLYPQISPPPSSFPPTSYYLANQLPSNHFQQSFGGGFHSTIW